MIHLSSGERKFVFCYKHGRRTLESVRSNENLRNLDS